MGLYNERDERSFAGQSLSQQLRSLRRLAAVERDLYRRPARPSEVRLLCREVGEMETLASTDDYARCADRLREQGRASALRRVRGAAEAALLTTSRPTILPVSRPPST